MKRTAIFGFTIIIAVVIVVIFMVNFEKEKVYAISDDGKSRISLNDLYEQYRDTNLYYNFDRVISIYNFSGKYSYVSPKNKAVYYFGDEEPTIFYASSKDDEGAIGFDDGTSIYYKVINNSGAEEVLQLGNKIIKIEKNTGKAITLIEDLMTEDFISVNGDTLFTHGDFRFQNFSSTISFTRNIHTGFPICYTIQFPVSLNKEGPYMYNTKTYTFKYFYYMNKYRDTIDDLPYEDYRDTLRDDPYENDTQFKKIIKTGGMNFNNTILIIISNDEQKYLGFQLFRVKEDKSLELYNEDIKW